MDVPVDKIKEFEGEINGFHSKHQKTLDDLAAGKLTDDITKTLEEVIREVVIKICKIEMANLKEIRSRITSVGSTMQITSAMKMVSAAKLKRAQDAITQMRPYSNKLTELLENLSFNLDSLSTGKYTEKRGLKNILFVPVSSNRGLCGGFNANIIKKTKELIKNEYSSSNPYSFNRKKTSTFLAKNNFNVVKQSDELFSDLTYNNVKDVAEYIINEFIDKKFDKVVLVYNRFKNAATQIVMTENFLPLEKKALTITLMWTIYLSLHKKK